MRSFRAELHVHTVLSPCAEIEMIPPLIVQTALEKGINLLAITDHNSTKNIAAVIKAAEGKDLKILPGMELQTREDVHLLCFFDSLEAAVQWQNYIETLMPPMKNNPDYFGEQFVVDETGDFIRREEQLLLTSASLSLNEAVTQVKELNGIAIPAHVDRSAFGLFTILGFVPADLSIDALEISTHLSLEEAMVKYPQLANYAIIQSGDVHRLDEFRGWNHFWMDEPSLKEIKQAFLGENGRRLDVHS